MSTERPKVQGQAYSAEAPTSRGEGWKAKGEATKNGVVSRDQRGSGIRNILQGKDLRLGTCDLRLKSCRIRDAFRCIGDARRGEDVARRCMEVHGGEEK